MSRTILFCFVSLIADGLFDGHISASWFVCRPVRKWQMRCGLVVFAFMLCDVDEGDGGLVVVPGSHKSNYPSAGVFTQKGDFESELARPVHNPGVKAGDLLIFNEATLHGTLP